ncbi:MAG: winged helix-turn-helix transcriptional regulator [Spirochaetia bacterium]|nr:winged helix-turn-helix transcriptional regulator [Spirochaetia bacterium]
MSDSIEIHSQLSDGEARLIASLSNESANQRNLAKEAGLSLGMTNLLIRRLVKKGLIKVVTLNGRTLSYMLTPTGFAEKLRRSYDYVTASIRYITQVRARIRQLVQEHSAESGRIYVLGRGEVVNLANETLAEMNREYVHCDSLDALPDDGSGLCLVCSPELSMEIRTGYNFQFVLE